MKARLRDMERDTVWFHLYKVQNWSWSRRQPSFWQLSTPSRSEPRPSLRGPAHALPCPPPAAGAQPRQRASASRVSAPLLQAGRIRPRKWGQMRKAGRKCRDGARAAERSRDYGRARPTPTPSPLSPSVPGTKWRFGTFYLLCPVLLEPTWGTCFVLILVYRRPNTSFEAVSLPCLSS